MRLDGTEGREGRGKGEGEKMEREKGGRGKGRRGKGEREREGGISSRATLYDWGRGGWVEGQEWGGCREEEKEDGDGGGEGG